MRRLEGRRALVTGAGSGIGRAVACRLAEEGAAVAVSGRRDGPLAETVGAIESAGGRAVAVVGDIAVEADAGRIAAAAAEEFGGLDVLVNNAGSIRRNVLVHELTLERWREQVAVNLDGPFLVSRAALRLMLEATGDRSIVNVSSTLALASASGVAAYTAAKGGVVALTRAIAVEYAERGIRCNCVCPAIVGDAARLYRSPTLRRAAKRLRGDAPAGTSRRARGRGGRGRLPRFCRLVLGHRGGAPGRRRLDREVGA